ncbi:MAG: hypothetical protein E3K40_15780 [Candidatus Brocadia sp.]|nr:hypothetical protein [Candidatus Brocadia sp.]
MDRYEDDCRGGHNYLDEENTVNNYLNDGGLYDPAINTWSATNTTDAPLPRDRHTAVWTGKVMIVWGGNSAGALVNTGGRYMPGTGTGTWSPTEIKDAPSARHRHTAVWTGTKMIVWGGYNQVEGPPTNDGGRYDPDKNTWVATPTTGAPLPRALHTAVWTGTEMIVWGGSSSNDTKPITPLNDGGRYNLTTDTWSATNTTGAPLSRSSHTAVWTGMEMIVWGGFRSGPPPDPTGILSDGGRYFP